MRVEVMDYYGLTKPLNRAGYYETEHHSQLFKNIRGAIHDRPDYRSLRRHR